MSRSKDSGGVRRVLGLSFDGRPIREPVPLASSLTFAATGGGKTTCHAVPTVQAMLADTERAILINDVKNGEIAAQVGEMCIKHGRKFGVIDDFHVLGADYPHRIEVNPFSSIQLAYERGDSDLPFLIEGMTHTLIPEPGGEGDAKNFYFREEPREFLGLGERLLLHRNPALCRPGGLYALLADVDLWNAAVDIAAEEAEGVTRFMAKHTAAMRKNNPEHYAQHLRAAITALKSFGEGPLADAGRAPDVTHEDILRENWIVCFVGPTRHLDRTGAYIAQHYNSLMDIQLTGSVGKADYIIDEYCAGPFESALKRLTTIRANGGRLHLIAQSRRDSVKRYTEHVTAILEENCTVKQWLKFSNFDEAERVSKAMGEQQVLQTGIGTTSRDADVSMNLSTGRARLFTADELMRLPDDEQIIHLAGIGFIHCRKIRQNQIAPTCHELGINPLEGGRLAPDPKITLPVPTIPRKPKGGR